MQTLWQDLRYASRLLRKSPGFTAVAILTLAVVIGANAVVFGVINALILRPLNVPQVETLYGVERTSDKTAIESYPNYLDLRDRNRSFDGLAGFFIERAALETDGNPSSVWLYEASGNYFDVLRIQPYLGRFFHAADEHGPNSAPFIVLTYSFWRTQFHGDRNAVGRIVQLNRHPYTILGVAPPGFHGTIMFASPTLVVPLVNQEQIGGWNGLKARENRWVLMPMGHLKTGVTPAQAIADLNAIGADLEKTYPKENSQMSFVLVRPSLFGDAMGGPVQAFLGGLLLLAGLILLAACANLGSLFAARAADRSREVALRMALGSSRVRVLRQLFTEALLISLMGGAVGLWLSVILLHWLSVWQPLQYPFNLPVEPSATVYGVALLLALVSGALFGAVPLKQVLHTDPYQIVKSSSLGQIGRRLTLRDALLGVQIAICAVLVTSSMVAVRGMWRSLHSSLGFQPQNALLMEANVTMAGYSGDRVARLQKRMIEAVEAIPGVTVVGLVDSPPLVGGGSGDSNVFRDEIADFRSSNAATDATIFDISPDYLRAAGTVLLGGREITWHDDKEAPRVAVVNQEFVRIVFGSPSYALNRYFKMPDGTRVQVVGLVENGKYQSLTERPTPAMFLPILQWPTNGTWLVVRSHREPRELTAAMRNRMREVDAAVPCSVGTWSGGLDTALFPARIATITLGILGVIGAILSVTGIFGLAAYSVSKRKKELGIRMALGAKRKEVLQAALGRAFKVLAVGSTAGLLIGILSSRVLALIVYQATSRDPLVLAGTVLAMLLLGFVATWIPAQRALSIDPATLLREE